MKYILIIFLFLSANAYSQCTKLVNGVIVPCTQDEINQRTLDSLVWKADFDTTSFNDSLRTIQFNNVITTAQSAVGVSVGSLTAAQVRALFLIVLYRFRKEAITKSGTIEKLNKWAQ
jgi:hypothetical protein